MVADKCPNGLNGLIGLNPNGLIGLIGLTGLTGLNPTGLIGLTDPNGLNYSLIKLYSVQILAKLMIVFIARFIVVSDTYSYLPWKFMPPVKRLGHGRPMNERREPSVPPRIGLT